MSQTGAREEVMFEIRTLSGRVAGPFSREKLKRYAKEKRLDPRCEIRKHDPGVENEWRPCWKTKGLFPREIVEACAQGRPIPKTALVSSGASKTGHASALAPEPAQAPQSVVGDDNSWAFNLESVQEEIEGAPPAMGTVAQIQAPPMPMKEKGSKRSGRARGGMSSIPWDRIAPWVFLVAVCVHLAIAIFVGLSDGGFETGRFAAGIDMGSFPLPRGRGVAVIAAVVIAAVSLVVSLLYMLGFVIVRERLPDFGDLYATAFFTAILAALFEIVSAITLHVGAAVPDGSPAFVLAMSQMFMGFIVGVSVVMIRHLLGPLKALVIYLFPTIVALLVIAAFAAVAGVAILSA